MSAKRILKQKVCFCSFFTAVAIILILSSVQRANVTAFLDVIYMYWWNGELEKLNGLNDVLYLDNVCIEDLAVPVMRVEANFSETKKLVVYGNYSRSVGQRRVPVAGSLNSRWNHWNIEFRNEHLPIDNISMFYTNTAFFVQPTCPGNFHHFLIDEYLPLYSVVTLANSLHPSAENQILYRTPQLSSDASCGSRKRYEQILRTLHTRAQHDVFYSLPTNTCFRKAVFGSKIHMKRQRDAIDHILAHFLLPNLNKSCTNDLYLTILSRRRRRILNEENLRELGLSVGFRNVRVVDFEKLTVEDQMEVASSSNVLVGVQGAGLQWAVFMPEGSHLVEIAWPSKHWGFYYRDFVVEFGIIYHSVEVTGVRENWTSYEASVRHGVQVSDVEKRTMLKSLPNSTADNLWKWADVFVHKKEILKTLEDIYTAIKSY